MFEKEAKKYSKERAKKLGINELNIVYHAMLIAYKNGAEFGYNKANEWHNVKDGDLPKGDIKLAIIEIDDCGYLLCNYRNGVWYDENSSAACSKWITNNIVRWKEIVPPKESEY